MRTISIRAATLADAPEVARLLTVLGHPTSDAEVRERWPAWGAEGNSALVAEGKPGSLVAVATLHATRVLHRPRPVGRITALVVEPALRGQGLGTRMMAEAEQVLTAWGCGLVEITSNLRRADAHAFYENLGYDRSSYRFVLNLPHTSP